MIRLYYENQFDKLDLTVNSSAHPPGPSWHTDIPRLRAGKVGGQVIEFFISVFYHVCKNKFIENAWGLINAIWTLVCNTSVISILPYYVSNSPLSALSFFHSHTTT